MNLVLYPMCIIASPWSWVVMLQYIQVILFSIQCAVAAMILIYPQQRMWSLWVYLLAMIMSCWSNPSYLEGANHSSCTLESWLFCSLFLLASIVLGMWFQMLLLMPLWLLPSILLICNCWLRIAALARLGRCRRVISGWFHCLPPCTVLSLHYMEQQHFHQWWGLQWQIPTTFFPELSECSREHTEQLSEILLVILLQPILKFRQALFGKASLQRTHEGFYIASSLVLLILLRQSLRTILIFCFPSSTPNKLLYVLMTFLRKHRCWLCFPG